MKKQPKVKTAWAIIHTRPTLSTGPYYVGTEPKHLEDKITETCSALRIAGYQPYKIEYK